MQWACRGLTESDGYTTSNLSNETLSEGISEGTIWLRVTADVSPGVAEKCASFAYSKDGTTLVDFGESHVMVNEILFYMGCRFGVFKYATQTLGGWVTVRGFDLSQ